MRALNLLGYVTIFDGNHELATEKCLQKALRLRSIKCSFYAKPWIIYFYRHKAPKEAESLRLQALSYSQQAIDLAVVYFSVNSVYRSHLQK